jgi:hypothetical protein
MRNVIVFALAICTTLAFAGQASAEDPAAEKPVAEAPVAEHAAPDHGLRYRSLSVIRLNPLGSREEAQVDYWYRLYDSDAKALENNYIGLGVVPLISPAHGGIGPILEFQPASVAKFWAKYQYYRYFGGFDLFQSFPTAEAGYGDDDIKAGGEAGENYGVSGTQLTLGGLLQIKIGPIAIRSALQAVRSDFDLNDGDTVFYDSTYDLLAPNGGWFYSNDADVLWVSDFGLVLGIRDTFTFTSYTDKQLGGKEDRNKPNHRLGPVIAYTFFDNPDPCAFDKPTAVLIASWYLNHSHRAGQDTNRAIPYVIMGFAFSGSL